MSIPLKPWKSFNDQLAILEERGMIIGNADKAIAALKQINYYRLTGYAFQFLNKSKMKYRGSPQLENIIALHEFDRELRSVLFSALEPIEILFRTQIAYHFSKAYGSDGHYISNNFANSGYHESFLTTLNEQARKNMRSPAIAHHNKKYSGMLPLWCAVEILPFSALSMLYSNMLIKEKSTIASALGMNEEYLSNWMHCFSVLRNTCAHYGRIYNNKISPKIKLNPNTFKRFNELCADTIFAYIIAILRCLPSEAQKESLKNEIVTLIHKYAGHLELFRLGFPCNWKSILFDFKIDII